MTSQDFNREWICRVDWQEIHSLVGFANLVSLLDDCAPRIFARLERCKADKLVVHPFHGATITFYAH